MRVLIGYLIIIFCVFGGFKLSGGHLLALYQPYELIIIAGAAIGSFIISNEVRVIKSAFRNIKGILQSPMVKREFNIQLLSFFFQLLTKVKKDGMLAIENDIQNPQESAIFKNYPLITSNKKLMEFICDHMQIITTGRVDPHHLDEIIDTDIETYEAEMEIPIAAVNKVADSLPAFGIVAAVMGVVHTMESMNKPPAILGGLVAGALVGTFLGVLLGYGFVAPLAVAMDTRRQAMVKTLQVVKVLLLASANGTAPTIAVELARKVLYSDIRPNSVELEEIVRQIKSGAKAEENVGS